MLLSMITHSRLYWHQVDQGCKVQRTNDRSDMQETDAFIRVVYSSFSTCSVSKALIARLVSTGFDTAQRICEFGALTLRVDALECTVSLCRRVVSVLARAKKRSSVQFRGSRGEPNLASLHHMTSLPQLHQADQMFGRPHSLV